MPKVFDYRMSREVCKLACKVWSISRDVKPNLTQLQIIVVRETPRVMKFKTGLKQKVFDYGRPKRVQQHLYQILFRSEKVYYNNS